mgnify:CR=1 FL=1
MSEQQQQGNNKPLSAVEGVKIASNYLRGNIRRDLDDPTKSHFDESEIQLIKHHGIYQQDDRDQRSERRKQKLDKAWMFMVRTRMPGGVITPEAYLILDDLCERRGNESLRVTTRQGFQFHGIGKENLGGLIEELNRAYITTLAACGDVCRNVMSHPLSDIAPDSPCNLMPLAERISRHLLPRTTAYFDVWLNGEKLEGGHFGELPEPISPIGLKPGPEPIYGEQYLPRKFKIGIAWAADNHVDLYTQDIGIEAVPAENGGGFNIIVGGGLGSSHGKKETYPRVGDRMSWVPDEQGVVAICEAITKVQRDFGDRTDRKHARMKYLVAERGVAWFKAEVEKMLGYATEPARPAIAAGQNYLLGWHRQKQAGMWMVGVRVENGRIRDFASGPRLRSGFQTICRRFPHLSMRLTAHHNVILANVPEADKPALEAMLAEFGMNEGSSISALRRKEMACVALPTCGLALAEAERYLPSLISDFEAAGYGDEDISIRMSGCPNSCSRPPASEIGLIGRAPGKYNIYLGGNREGTRFNWLWRETVKDSELVSTIGPVIDRWRQEGKSRGLSFGDWCEAAKESLAPVSESPNAASE